MGLATRRANVGAVGIVAATVALGVFGSAAWSEVARAPRLAPVPAKATTRPENTTKCNYQDPHDFMVRENFVLRGRMTKEERVARNALHERSIEFRTKMYGYFPGFGNKAWNARSPLQNAKSTTFFGLTVRLNERILPVIGCVEEQLRTECAEKGYQPKRLSGIRDKNTYHNNEVSNHVYGIGLDIDPTENTCCGCVGHWAEHPACQRDVASIYDRMVMPECWVNVFERFGFHWLGRDRLQDSMHFEFLGHPDYILKSAGAPPAASAAATGPAGDGGPAGAAPLGGDAGPAATPAPGGDAGPTTAPRTGDGGGAAPGSPDAALLRPSAPVAAAGEAAPRDTTSPAPAGGCRGCSASAASHGRGVGLLAVLGVGASRLAFSL